jgi:hypothetical protein
MKVFGQLEYAQLEVLSSDPGTNTTARFWWNSTDGQFLLDDGTNQYAMLRNDDKIIIGNDATAANNLRLHRGSTSRLQVLTGDDTTAEGSMSTSIGELSFKAESHTDGAKPAAGNAGRIIWNSTLTKLQSDDGTDWQDIGSGGGTSAVNYIENGLAESSTTGWTRYANTSAANKPDDFGGSANANVTWTRITSGQLRGTGSFRLTKDASNRQGEGVYYAFTLENADLHSVLKLAMDANTSSGYADGDVRFYLVGSNDSFSSDFDIIEITPTEMLAGEYGRVDAYVQTHPTNTDYRLCIHIASTSATAWTADVDAVEFGKAPRNYGSPDVYLGELTTTGSWTSNVTYTGKYWRKGDILKAKVRVDVTGSISPTGALTLNLPSGHVMDITKNISDGIYREIFGTAQVLDTGIAFFKANAVYNSTTSLTFMAWQQTDSTFQNALYGGGSQLISNSYPTSLVSGDKIFIEYEVPISGWSSNMRLSDVDSGRVIACELSGDGSTTNNASANTWTKVTVLDADKDTNNAWSEANNEYIIPESGWYDTDFYARMEIHGEADYTALAVSIYKNSAIYATGASYTALTGLISAGVSKTVYYEKGDKIEFYVNQSNSDNDTLAVFNVSSRTFASIKKVQGPSAIGASEVVACVATLSSPQTGVNTNNSLVVITVDTVVKDTHAAFDTSGNQYVIPVSGWYNIVAGLTLTGTNVLNDRYNLSLNLGTTQAYFPLAGESTAMQASGIEYYDKGDTVNLRIYGAGDNSVNTLTVNDARFSIARIGGI